MQVVEHTFLENTCTCGHLSNAAPGAPYRYSRDKHFTMLNYIVCKVIHKSFFPGNSNDDGIPVSVGVQLDPGFAVFPWPETVAHTIDSSSPLWNMSADDLEKSDFELVVIVEGTVESTGVGCQYMTSYKSSEIRWGHTFTRLAFAHSTTSNSVRCAACANYIRCWKAAGWTMDCSRFDETIACETTPRCSARQRMTECRHHNKTIG